MNILKCLLLLLLTFSLSADGVATVTGGTRCIITQVSEVMFTVPLNCTTVLSGANTNEAPVPISTTVSSAEEGASVNLVGTSSTDDGSIVAYLWEQSIAATGDTISISNAATATGSFTAPASGQTAEFFLYVTDNEGALSSLYVPVEITVPAVNQAPVADAGVASSHNENTIVTLDGSASSDVNSNIESCVWSQTGGTAVTIVLTEQCIATFTPPDVASPTPLTFNLLVTDTGALFDNDSVIKTINAVTVGTVYYVSNCLTGADVDCVAGSDANDGLSMANAWQTYDKAQDIFASLSSGDEIRFADGGSFTVAGSNQWVNDNTLGADPIIVSNYTPTWQSGDELEPIITQASASPVFSLNNSGAAMTDGGYTFRNLDLECSNPASPSSGITFGNDVDDLVIDNVDVEGCRLGFFSQISGTCEQEDLTCNARNDRYTIRNSNIINNPGSGMFGHGDDIVIENNTFVNNGDGTQFGHNLYLSGSITARISGNDLYQSSLDGSDDCAGTSFVIHGENTDLLIENNVIHEDVGDALSACWGIQLSGGYGSSESFTDVIIRGNDLDNMGSSFINVASCINCTIENNNLNQTQEIGTNMIQTRVKRSSEDLESNNIDVKLNIITFNNDSGKGGVDMGSEGTGHEITGNSVTAVGSGSFTCLDPDSTTANVTVADNTCSP